MRKIKEVIVHYSASDSPFYDFEAIKKDHIARGYDDIGYHYGVHYDSSIHELRNVEIIGAHCKGHNTYSIGVVVLGLKNITDDQKMLLAGLCDWLLYKYKLSPTDINPHNKHAKTLCPGFDFYGWRKEYFGV